MDLKHKIVYGFYVIAVSSAIFYFAKPPYDRFFDKHLAPALEQYVIEEQKVRILTSKPYAPSLETLMIGAYEDAQHKIKKGKLKNLQSNPNLDLG
ncbi:hypothetical protein HYX04_02400 [Candidatus Woesearchaeota archaeon]|nr:hypothetical protein [Candidatus Woesearchaeota archaeon]